MDQQPKQLSRPALAGMMLAAALAPLGSTMIAVALPAIGDDLHAADADLTQWLVASYLVASIALQSPGGKLGDMISHRRALLLGLALVAGGSVLGFAVTALPLLALARVLMACGGAAIVPAVMAIVRNNVPEQARARAFGMFGACMGLAAAVGPLIGGELTTLLGWRFIFAANLPVIAVSLSLVLTGARAPARPAAGPRARFDFLGSLLLGGGLTLVVVALRMPAGLWLGLAGGVCLALFPLWERRVASPVVDFALFRSRAFTAGGLIIALQNLAMYALLFQLPILFKQVRQSDSHEMGRALLALTLAMVAASLVGGRLSEKLGARVQVGLGSVLALGGLWLLRDPGALASPLDAVPGLLLMGAGIGLSSAPSQAAAMTGASRENAGMAGGAISTLRYMGGVAGIAVLGATLTDAASIELHRAPIMIYGGALAISALLALLLPGRAPKG